MIIEERQRQARNHPHTIHPFSLFTKYWQIFMTIVWFIMLAHDMFYISFNFEIEYKTNNIWNVITLFMNSICMFDIMVNLITGYVDKENNIELSERKIAGHHLRLWLLVDLVTIFVGTGLLSYKFLNNFHLTNAQVNYIIIIRYIRILKVFNIYDGIRWLVDTSLISYFHYWIICWCFVFFSLLWVLGSMYYKIGYLNFTHSFDHRNLSWVNFYVEMYGGIHADSKLDASIYFHSLMECLLKLNWFRPISFATPVLISEAFFVVLIILIGLFFQTVFIVLLYIFEYDLDNTFFIDGYFENALNSYLNLNSCSVTSRKSILNRYEHLKLLRITQDNYKEFPSSLKFDFNQHKATSDIRYSELFLGLDEDLAEKIISEMLYDIYPTNYVLFRAGDETDCIYYLCSGGIAVYDSFGNELLHLVDDNYFGLIDPDTEGTPFRELTLISIELCDVLILPLKTIRNYCKKSTSLKQTLKKMAQSYDDSKESHHSMINYLGKRNFSQLDSQKNSKYYL